MALWKKVALLYPVSVIAVTSLYTLETLSVNRTQPSADSLSFIVFVLMGVPLCVLTGLCSIAISAFLKRKDIALASLVATVSVSMGVISAVFLTGLLISLMR